MQKPRSLLWILLNLALGIAGGVTLGWGPLAGSTPLIAVLGVVGALLGGSIGCWSERENSHRWVLWGHGLILLGVALAALIPLYRIGSFPMPGETRLGNFERLWQAMAYAYPYFEAKDVAWDEVYARYRPRVARADSDEAYWRVIGTMLTELNDGHTGLTSPSPRAGRRYFAICRDVNRLIVLDEVGATARAAGLQRGDIVLAVDDLAVEEALTALPPVLRDGSTPQQRRAQAASNVLSTTQDTLKVTVTGPAGERTVTLVWPDAPPTPEPEEAEVWQPLVTGRRLPSGVGLIRVPTFQKTPGHDLVAEFDAALDGLLEAPALVLDLRGNGGGTTFISDRIAGRFLSERFTYGREYFRARLPQRGWRPRLDYHIRPRGTTYTGSLILLIDVDNFSTAENFIVALVDSGRAMTVGRQTGGGSGNPVSFNLTGSGRVRFSTGDFRRLDGTPIEGVGIAPDIPVTWTVEAFREGRDPDLAAAETLLSKD